MSQLNSKLLSFASYAAFSESKEKPGSKPLALFSALFVKKDISLKNYLWYFINWPSFTDWNIGQYVVL